VIVDVIVGVVVRVGDIVVVSDGDAPYDNDDVGEVDPVLVMVCVSVCDCVVVAVRLLDCVPVDELLPVGVSV
jgi:hypothetical protein